MFKKKKYTDPELIDLIKQGNSDKALKYLYRSVQPKVRIWILQNNGDKEEAQDIFQDSIVAFYNYVLNGKFKTENSVEGFIFGVAKNKWVNRVKQKNRTTRIEEVGKKLAIENTSSVDEFDKVVFDLLERLGDVCKELLTYSIFYKLTMEDIALKMGYENGNTAKTKNYKCKQRLVKLVRDKEGLKKILYNE